MRKVKIEDIEQIRIIGKTFKLNLVDTLIHDGELQHGICDVTNCFISISGSQCQEQKKDTVIHECAHAIADAMGVDVPEHHILVLSTGLYAWMKANPELIQWIMQND